MFYFRARYHDPVLGRFLERDPLGYPDGLNSYAAYHVMWGGVDPWGEKSILDYVLKPGVIEVDVPAGPIDIIGTLTIEDASCDCYKVTLSAGVSWSIKERVVKRIPSKKARNFINKHFPWDITAQIFVNGSGYVAKQGVPASKCAGFCSASITGSVTGGNGAHGGAGNGRILDAGFWGDITGEWDWYQDTITASAGVSAAVSVNGRGWLNWVAYNRVFSYRVQLLP